MTRAWRSFEALADTPAFRAQLAREFPAVTDLCVGPERRQFMKLMAASFALAGLSGCDDPPDGRDHEVPYVRAPERQQPGVTQHFASIALQDGLANGILVTCRDGRPLKIEGNPEHPWNGSGTDVFMQASVLGLYDPARSRTVRQLDRSSTWTAFRGATIGRLAALRANGAEGVRLLTGPVTSPLLEAQIRAMLAAYPGMRWHAHAAVDRSALYDGTARAFGRPLETRWRFDAARVVVALDGDFLDAGPQQAGNARQWSAARKASIASGTLMALHAAGPVPTLTRAKADFAVPATTAELAALADGLLADMSGPGAPPAAVDASPLAAWRARAAAALHGARGASLVVAGSHQPAELQEAVHRLNAALGNTDKTVFYTRPAVAEAERLPALVEDMRDGKVQVLVTLDANPAYDAPGELDFAGALQRVPLKIHAGPKVDETALRSDWHLPLAHPLEAWGDARSLDGTIGLMQPTIDPLYEGRAAAAVVALLTDGQEHDARSLLRAHYQDGADTAAFAPLWDAAVRQGFLPGTAFAPEAVTLRPAPAEAAPRPAPVGLDVLFRPDPTVWDGAVADNPWLQELPKPLTKLVWENAVTIGPALAAREGLVMGDMVAVIAGGRRIEGPVWILPGQADGAAVTTLGYGRTVPDRIAFGLGYDANRLRAADSAWQLAGARLEKTGRRQDFATTQDLGTMEGHDLVRVQRVRAPRVGSDEAAIAPSLYPPIETGGRAWGMVIDLDACIGCNACVTACQSENNIAVVGREQVALGRWMHWIRVDRYYDGEPEAPQTHFQPVPCMHCEDAPCEVGCPVEATLHDHEGLNLMVYNRCIGTRACSGYCPYKVRRFNYLDYSAGAAPSVQLQRNPAVTVRSRGVMEKCTYCVQRIADARITAHKGDETIRDGAVQTACQGACPTQAITFGDLRDPGSAVAAARRDDRNYALLGDLNVRPRTTYLAAMAPASPAGDG